MRADEIKAVMSKGIFKMMEKEMMSLKITEKISGNALKPKPVQDFRGGA